MQIQKKTCINRSSKQKIGPSYFDRALVKVYMYPGFDLSLRLCTHQTSVYILSGTYMLNLSTMVKNKL